jgi:hypothetical protein
MNFNELRTFFFACALDCHLTKTFDCCVLFTDGATIESISENVIVNPGEEAKLSCSVKGKTKEK